MMTDIRTATCGCQLTWEADSFPYYVASIAPCVDAVNLEQSGRAVWDASKYVLSSGFETVCLGDYYRHIMDAVAETRTP